jgi:hypothetical protein
MFFIFVGFEFPSPSKDYTASFLYFPEDKTLHPCFSPFTEIQGVHNFLTLPNFKQIR